MTGPKNEADAILLRSSKYEYEYYSYVLVPGNRTVVYTVQYEYEYSRNDPNRYQYKYYLSNTYIVARYSSYICTIL